MKPSINSVFLFVTRILHVTIRLVGAKLIAKSNSRLSGNLTTLISSNYTLFAVLDNSRCAESLVYGPSALTEVGSDDGYTAYLCTDPPHKNVLHTQWLQIVNFVDDYPPCLIRWTFDASQTLRDHFVFSVDQGVHVSYYVECPSKPQVRVEALWRFNPLAGNMTHKFDVAASSYGFSDRYGAWGTGATKAGFWGVGNIDGFDEENCPFFYADGDAAPGQRVKSTHMYFARE